MQNVECKKGSIQANQKNSLKATLIVSSIDGHVQASLYVPILALIAQTFQDDVALVNFAFSVTSGVMIPFIFVSGYLAKYIDKKYLMIVGTLIFAIGGFFGSFAESISFLIAVRAVEGVGAGLVYPLVPAITAQLFEGYARSSFLGKINGGGCAIAFVLNFAAGAVGTVYGWRACFLIYAFLIPIAVMQFLFIPKLGPDKNLFKSKAEEKEVHVRIPSAVWVLVLLTVLLETIGEVTNLLISGFVVNSGIGTSLIAGTSNSIRVFVGFVFGMVFLKVLKRFKGYTASFALFMNAICYFGLSISNTPLMVYCSIFFLGVGFGTLIPLINDAMARIAPRARMTLCMAFVSIGMMSGFFLSNFYADFLIWITGNVYCEIFGIQCAVFLIASIIFFVWAFRKRGQLDLR